MTDPFQKPNSADTVREAVPVDSPELGCAVQRHLKARINPKSRHSFESGHNIGSQPPIISACYGPTTGT